MTARPRSPDRVSALALGLGSLLMLFAMAHHPTGVTHAASVEAMARGAALAAWVHGVLIGLMLVVLFGYLGLVEALGWRSRRVRAGLVAYLFGTIFMTGAALVSGFVASRFALEFARSGESGALGPTLRFGWETNQALAQGGTLALSAAIVAWSAVLVGRDRWDRWLGAAGLLLGGGPALAVASGSLRLDVHGMGVVLLAQAAWALGVAIWLWKAPHAGQSQAKTPPVDNA